MVLMEILGFYLDSETMDFLTHDFLSTSRGVSRSPKLHDPKDRVQILGVSSLDVHPHSDSSSEEKGRAERKGQEEAAEEQGRGGASRPPEVCLHPAKCLRNHGLRNR